MLAEWKPTLIGLTVRIPRSVSKGFDPGVEEAIGSYFFLPRPEFTESITTYDADGQGREYSDPDIVAAVYKDITGFRARIITYVKAFKKRKLVRKDDDNEWFIFNIHDEPYLLTDTAPEGYRYKFYTHSDIYGEKSQ